MFVQGEQCAGEADGSCYIQEKPAPLDSTSAARLAMARKILFDMGTPPSSVGFQPVASANGLPEVPLRSTGSRRTTARCSVCSSLLFMRQPQGLPDGQIVGLTSPAHCSLCSCQLSVTLTGPRINTIVGVIQRRIVRSDRPRV